MKTIVDVLLPSTLRNFHVDLRNLSSDILETSFLTIGQSNEPHREKFDSWYYRVNPIDFVENRRFDAMY